MEEELFQKGWKSEITANKDYILVRTCSKWLEEWNNFFQLTLNKTKMQIHSQECPDMIKFLKSADC